MEYKIPSYSFEEEYIDDPHWNSGFWQTTFKFNDGIQVEIRNKKDLIPNEMLENFYTSHSFEIYWNNVKSKYRDIARNEFFKMLEQQTAPQTI